MRLVASKSKFVLLNNKYGDGLLPLAPRLTMRQRQLGRLIHAGFTTWEISVLWGVNGATVRGTAYLLAKALQVHSRIDISRMVDLNWDWFLFTGKRPFRSKLVGMKRLPARPIENSPLDVP